MPQLTTLTILCLSLPARHNHPLTAQLLSKVARSNQPEKVTLYFVISRPSQPSLHHLLGLLTFKLHRAPGDSSLAALSRHDGWDSKN